MTDERRVEVAAEAPKWADLYGADPNFTLGMDASRYLTHQRGECPDDVPCALCLLERATAALDAHDGDLRERLAGAVEHRRTGPGRCACGYDAYKVGGFFPDYHAMLMNHLDRAPRAVTPANTDDVLALVAALRDAQAANDSLAGMVEWLCEVIGDARNACQRAESITPTGPPEWVESGIAMRTTVLREVRQVLDRERNANPSRYDASRTALAALIAELRALHRPTAAVDHGAEYDACVTCFDEYERPTAWPCPTAALLDRHVHSTEETP